MAAEKASSSRRRHQRLGCQSKGPKDPPATAEKSLDGGSVTERSLRKGTQARVPELHPKREGVFPEPGNLAR